MTKNLQGRLARVKHRDSLEDNWVETIFRYDDLGRVARVGDGEANPKVVHYEYNNSGLVTKMTYPTNTPTEIEYSYDSLGRRCEIKNQSSNRVYATNYQYNIEHQLVSRTLNPESDPYDEIIKYDFQERPIDKEYKANSDSYFKQQLDYLPGFLSQIPVNQLENAPDRRTRRRRGLGRRKASNNKNFPSQTSVSNLKFKANRGLAAFQSDLDFETDLYLEDNRYCTVFTDDDSGTTLITLHFTTFLPNLQFSFTYQSMFEGYKIEVLGQGGMFLRVSNGRFIAGTENNATLFELEEEGEGFRLKQLLDPDKYWGLDEDTQVIFVERTNAVTMYKDAPSQAPEGYIFCQSDGQTPPQPSRDQEMTMIRGSRPNGEPTYHLVVKNSQDPRTRFRIEEIVNVEDQFHIKVLDGEAEDRLLAVDDNHLQVESFPSTSSGNARTRFAISSHQIPPPGGYDYYVIRTIMIYVNEQVIGVKSNEAVRGAPTSGWWLRIGEPVRGSLAQQSAGALLNATYKSDFIVNTTFQGSKYNFSDLDVVYDYDYLGRLIASAKESETSYQYDRNGNLDRIDGRSYEYFSGSNKLQRIVDNSQTIREVTDYDNLGNITVMTNSEGQQVTLTRRVLGDLVNGVQIQGGSTITLQYDGLGRRVKKQSTTTEEYIYGRGKLPLVVKGVAGVEELLYIYDGDSIIGFEENGNTTYLLSDHLGSTRVAIDSNNNSLCSFEYDDFGKTVVAPSSENEAQKVSFRYAGQWWDEDLQLYHYHSRFYDPDLRRFISIDPAREGFSPYVYVGNNPINRIDPSGLFSFKKRSGSYDLLSAQSDKKSEKKGKFDIIKEMFGEAKERLSELEIPGKTEDSQSEYTISSELFDQNNYGSQLQNTTSGIRPETRLHETYIGTTAFSSADSPRFTLASYLEPQRNLIEAGDINSVLQFSQLDYAIEPDFQAMLQTPESKAMNDSFEQMTTNIPPSSYTQGDKEIAVTPLLRDKVELILARRAAETGRFLTKAEEEEIREMLGI
ncbi:MAG: RHS repeat-associated core domain-containing protein [Moorea sp. SIO4E2]|uniref:RHS repeat domain-containing protein n=1 Tax=Moorena sp. SIO4E2 TaxID=2607826 RepID=UPI0013B60193|nr:RHS repeat-associated core domain-containing protein [Moorena sp. SIO4E2]NEQ10666.1 RHS repeat-associated core domain-containing protein [Moorena sp. SIO4E2]